MISNPSISVSQANSEDIGGLDEEKTKEDKGLLRK